jgi:hypothetical protein
MSNAQFKHIAILVPAVAKSFHSNTNEMKRKNKKPVYNKTYKAYPTGYAS